MISAKVSRPGPGVLVCSSSCVRRMSTMSRASSLSVMGEESEVTRLTMYQDDRRMTTYQERRTDSVDTDSLTTRSYLREWRPIPRLDGRN